MAKKKEVEEAKPVYNFQKRLTDEERAQLEGAALSSVKALDDAWVEFYTAEPRPQLSRYELKRVAALVDKATVAIDSAVSAYRDKGRARAERQEKRQAEAEAKAKADKAKRVKGLIEKYGLSPEDLA